MVFFDSFFFFAAPRFADGNATIGYVAATGSSASSLTGVGSANGVDACRSGAWKSSNSAKDFKIICGQCFKILIARVGAVFFTISFFAFVLLGAANGETGASSVFLFLVILLC